MLEVVSIVESHTGVGLMPKADPGRDAAMAKLVEGGETIREVAAEYGMTVQGVRLAVMRAKKRARTGPLVIRVSDPEP